MNVSRLPSQRPPNCSTFVLGHPPLNAAARGAFEALERSSDGAGPVFRRKRGKPLKKPRHWWERVLKEAGIEDFRWHDLRHTFASRLVMKGVDIRTVAQLLGHRTLQMVMRYAHLSQSHELAAVERLCNTDQEDVKRSDTRSDTSGKVNLQEVA